MWSIHLSFNVNIYKMELHINLYIQKWLKMMNNELAQWELNKFERKFLKKILYVQDLGCRNTIRIQSLERNLLQVTNFQFTNRIKMWRFFEEKLEPVPDYRHFKINDQWKYVSLICCRERMDLCRNNRMLCNCRLH